LVPVFVSTSTRLFFVDRVALLIWPLSTCVRNCEYGGGSVRSPGLISFCAKNARTTTIRIGNAALLKNLLTTKGPRW
jgi:hypothetical protein